MRNNQKKRIKKDGRPGPVRGIKYKNQKISPANVKAGTDARVRSRLEKECVEYFEKNNIKYTYEPLILIAGRKFRPDFFLIDYDLFIEICGYNHMPFYTAKVEQKRKLYQQHGIKAAFIIHKKGESVTKKLAELLKDYR